MRIFDDGIMPVDFDKGTVLGSLRKAEAEKRRDRVRNALAAAVLTVLFLALVALKYWLYLPGARS